jgi:hypothetical protein
MQNDEAIKRKLPYLLSIPGVGILTAATVIAETRGFADTVNCRQIAGYCGLDVQISESGTWKGQSRISKKGNSHLRHALYMPALSKIRYVPSTKERYEKLKGRTCPMKAIVAECRKMICLMYTLWKKEEMYSPDYKNDKNKSAGNDTDSSVNPGPTVPPVSVEERKNEVNDVAETVKNDKNSSVNPDPTVPPVNVEEQKNECGDVAGTVMEGSARRMESSEKTAPKDKNGNSDVAGTVEKDSAPCLKSGNKTCVKHIKNKYDAVK